MQYYYLASTYGSGSYNTGTYNATSTTNTGSSSGSSADGATGSNALTDTGIILAVVITVACLIALAAIAVRIWKRPAAAPLVEQEADIEEPAEPSKPAGS